VSVRSVFVAGGTGYIGSRLIPELLSRGHCVAAVARKGSERKLPSAGRVVSGDVLNADTYAASIMPGDTFVQLVGVPHPSPAKAKEFVSIDRRAAIEAIRVASERGVDHFVYVSVAHPAPAMHAYIAVRSECEETLRASGLRATILRPWYVLGPGHYWPYALKPFYWIAERIPSTAEGAKRLGLVTLDQMVRALARTVDDPPENTRIVDVPAIRAS
jgi:uncharacterized protein YbjT (DUF2867 family)